MKKIVVPYAFGTRFIAWIGRDGDLYLATLTGDSLRTDGILDAPIWTPFRSVDNAAVFYATNTPGGTLYLNYFRESTFDLVEIIPSDGTNFSYTRSIAHEVY